MGVVRRGPLEAGAAGRLARGPGRARLALRAIAVGVAATVLVLAVTGAAAGALGVLGTYSSGGSGEGQFSGANAIAVGPDRSIYVADIGNLRVQKFTADGAPVARWGSIGVVSPLAASPSYTLGVSPFYNGPRGIAVDGAGNVYTTDLFARILRFTATGALTREWGSEGGGPEQLNVPRGLATDRAGNVYVADSGNHRVQVFTADGVHLRTIGLGFGNGPGQLGVPFDLAVAGDGSVFVVEEYNHRVSKFDAAGVFVLSWGTQGTADGQLAFPNGIDVDRDGNVWVADSGNARLQKFDPNGRHLLTYKGTGAAFLNNPKALATDPDGSVLTIPIGENARIERIGELPPPAPPPASPPAIAGALPAAAPRVVDLDYDPVKRQFFIKVQYRLRDPCPTPCRARAEIRTRLGRRIFARPLPGDGRLVFGRQPTITLARGRRVRFLIPIDKSALLDAHFVTVGRHKIAETRMRVWLKERNGELLTVRDGRIRISIARIESGALPGLEGILG